MYFIFLFSWLAILSTSGEDISFRRFSRNLHELLLKAFWKPLTISENCRRFSESFQKSSKVFWFFSSNSGSCRRFFEKFQNSSNVSDFFSRRSEICPRFSENFQMSSKTFWIFVENFRQFQPPCTQTFVPLRGSDLTVKKNNSLRGS